jgi:hypothetical protein
MGIGVYYGSACCAIGEAVLSWDSGSDTVLMGLCLGRKEDEEAEEEAGIGFGVFRGALATALTCANRADYGSVEYDSVDGVRHGGIVPEGA